MCFDLEPFLLLGAFIIPSVGLIIVATITPYWKIDKSDDLFKNIFPDYNQGLWVRCNQEIKSAKWICSGLEDVYKEIPLEIKVQIYISRNFGQ